MSLSKEQLSFVSQPAQPRQAKCARCRHHGIVVPQKGHMKQCPFLQCDCWKCYLITQRTRITALQRGLKKAQPKPCGKEPRPRGPAGVSPTEAPDGVPRASATPEQTCPRPAAAAPGCPPTNTTSTAWSPLDLRSRHAPGGDHVAGSEGREVLPLSSGEKGPCSPFNAVYFDELGQTPPLPAVHFPFRMSGHYPSPYPNFLFNVPWLPPVPAGFYNSGLCGPRLVPHFQQGAMHYPPPPELVSPADCRQVFFTLQPPPLQEAFQEGLLSRQHPQPPLPRHSEPNTEELD